MIGALALLSLQLGYAAGGVYTTGRLLVILRANLRVRAVTRGRAAVGFAVAVTLGFVWPVFYLAQYVDGWVTRRRARRLA